MGVKGGRSIRQTYHCSLASVRVLMSHNPACYWDSLTLLYVDVRTSEKRNVYRLLVGKPEGKRPLGRPRRRWIDNIKMDILELGVSVVDWTGLAQDRYRWKALVNSVMNLRVP
jgi:hypothetical protein